MRRTPAFGEILAQEWQAAGLPKPSVITGVTFTAEKRIVVKRLGQLKARPHIFPDGQARPKQNMRLRFEASHGSRSPSRDLTGRYCSSTKPALIACRQLIVRITRPDRRAPSNQVMFTMHYNFEWDPAKARDNRSKHGVGFEQAAELFADPLALSLFDAEDSTDEETRWITLGRTANGETLVVVHTFDEAGEVATVRIISARKATRLERKTYEER